MNLSEELYRKFIGGSGLGAYLLLKYTDANFDAFSPENPLIFITGPLTGTITPSSGRHSVVSRSPLTSFYGESSSGGYWGTYLKKAGYDGIVVTGKSDKPVYLYVNEETVDILDASELWGLNFYDTQKELKNVHGSKVKVSAIGRAGEKRVRFAAIMNDHGRAAGRLGMGAVMGSKNLKAIVVYGEKNIEVFSEEFYDFAKEKSIEVRESTGAQFFRQYGTAFYVDYGYGMGDVPAKYYTEGEFPAESVSGITLVEEFDVSPIACYACPIACGRLVRLQSKNVDGPEYESIVMLGVQSMVFDLKKIIEANDLCNDYGLDTISTGAVIALAHFMFEKGVLSEKDVGFKLEWGDSENIVNLVKMIGEREGFGDILAEGSNRVAEKYGFDLEYVATVKGLDIPAHDPRASFGQALSYATSNNGADHNRADYFLVDMGAFEDEEAGITQSDRFTLVGKVESVINHQNFRELYNALSICIFTNLTLSELTSLTKLATGWETSAKELMQIGERLYNLKRGINNLYGVTREHDKLPKIVLEPYKNGNIAGITPANELSEALNKYYEIRGWDKETGKPTKEKLQELGLNELISKLY